MGRSKQTSLNPMQRPVMQKVEYIEVSSLRHRERKGSNTSVDKTMRTNQLKRCRADELALTPVATSFSSVGRFYPNFSISQNAIMQDQMKPMRGDMRDDSLSNHLFAVQDQLVTGIAPSTFLVYAGYGNEKDDVWDFSDATTAWMPEHNGKRFGATALHLLQSMDPTKTPLHLYIANTAADRAKDLFKNFKAKQMWMFTEVFVHTPSLVARQEYIHNLAAKKNVALAAENLDPEFGLALHTTVDICFFTFPDTLELATLAPYEVIQNVPASNSAVFSVGFHGVVAGKSSEFEEYAQTTAKLIPANRLLHPELSVSIGRFIDASSGIANIVSTMEVMSSGSATINVNLQAFGIGVGSFYYIPEFSEEKEPDWKLKNEDNIFLCNVQVPEPGYVDIPQMKNRNCVVLFRHSAVQSMMATLV